VTNFTARLGPGFAGVEVYDLEGHPHRLGELWKDHPCVLVFVRQFG